MANRQLFDEEDAFVLLIVRDFIDSLARARTGTRHLPIVTVFVWMQEPPPGHCSQGQLRGIAGIFGGVL